MSHQGDSLAVIRIRTRETLARPDIAGLILRGARECGFPVPSAVLAELCLNPGADSTGIFVGMVEDEPRLVVVGLWLTSAFWLAATVVLVYSDKAPHALVKATGSHLRAWFLEGGFDHVIVGNFLHTDRAYIKGLAHFGRASRVGSAIRFDFA